MPPPAITTPTTLSIDKMATLLQTLVDLETNTPAQVPRDIQKAVSDILEAQKNLVKKIDGYMHSKERNVKDIGIVSAIVKSCPDFLATKDRNGNMPIHWFASNAKLSPAYVPLVAEIGRRHEVGGEGGRGGLLVKTNNGWNVLQLITDSPSTDTIKRLRSAEPPLLVREDVKKYHLLHEAVRDQRLETAKYMADLDASCLFHSDDKYDIPIRYACINKNEGSEERGKNSMEMIQFLLQRSIEHNPSHWTVGGLFAKTHSNDLVLDLIIKRCGEDKAWDCIEQVLSPFQDLPILHQTIKYAPNHYSMMFSRFPESVHLRDSDNRLPIHLALETGMKWSFELLAIIQANRSNLSDVDPVTKWPPFALAASEKSCDLRTIYFLLRKNPEHVNFGLKN